MKFTCIKTGQISFDGLRASSFINGRDYEVPDEHHALLQTHGIAAAEKPKAAHPVQDNKMAHPVIENKARQQGRTSPGKR